MKPARVPRADLDTYEARDGEIYRNGFWLHRDVAVKLLAIYRATDDWFAPIAAQHAEGLEKALREAGIVTDKHERKAA